MFKLKEAIARSEMNGKKVLKKEISARLWENSNETTQQVNMTGLLNGKRKGIKLEWVPIICEMLDCTPNFLFGIEDE